MIKAGVRITRDDVGLKNLAKTVDKIARLRVSVGIQGPEADETYEDGTTVADVATYNEYGTKNIPARSFIRRTAVEDRTAIGRSARDAFEVLDKKPTYDSAVGAMEKIGEDVGRMIQAKIDSSPSWAKPNAASTIAKKGFDHPLRETRKLEKSITYRVHSPAGTIRSGKP